MWVFDMDVVKAFGAQTHKRKIFVIRFCVYLGGGVDYAGFMPATLTISDETASGQKTNTFTLDCLTERMTVRELIRARIYQEVHDYNLKEPEYFRGLVEPTEAEKTLNGYKLRKRRKIDWEDQNAKALAAFSRNGFFVLVGDRQAESLDEEFEVKVDTEISFVKLLPLVGG